MLALPFFPELAHDDQERVAEALRAAACDNPHMADAAPKMVFLGFGKYARADKIYALEPITDERAAAAGGRSSGSRASASRSSPRAPSARSCSTWASATRSARRSSTRRSPSPSAWSPTPKGGPMLRRSIKAEAGVDLDELARRARRLLEATSAPAEPQSLFEQE